MSEPWRYATNPPNCDALKKANDAVKEEAKKKNNDKDLIDEKGELKRKLSMDPNNTKDGHYRKIWMDAYIKAGGHASYDKRKLAPPGSLSEYCKPKKPTSKLGTLVVTVNDQNGPLLEKANVQIIDLLKKYETNDKGIAKFKDLEKKNYSVHAWKDEYTEEVEMSPTVLPDIETPCQITLKRQLPGILPVLVLDQDNKPKPVQDATVSAEPVSKSPGSYKTRTAKTNPAGKVTFDKLRYNTYKVTAVKDGSISETKRGVVSKADLNDQVTLKIDLRIKVPKDFRIWVDRARWISIEEGGASGVDAFIVFEIKDMETGRTAKYETKPKMIGTSVSFPSIPGVPLGGGYTTGEGEPKQFQVPRYLGKAVMDETKFSGNIIIVMGKARFIGEVRSPYLKVVFKFIRDCQSKDNATVDNIKLGPIKDPPSIIDLCVLRDGNAKLTKRHGI